MDELVKACETLSVKHEIDGNGRLRMSAGFSKWSLLKKVWVLAGYSTVTKEQTDVRVNIVCYDISGNYAGHITAVKDRNWRLKSAVSVTTSI